MPNTNVNTTNSQAMSNAMKVFYNTELLENARDEAVYGQLGKPQQLPAGHGKTVEWRKWNTLPEPDQLQEGVVPDGKTFGQTALTVTVAQYGEYVTVSDQLQLHAVDDTILGAAEEVGAAMGRKADCLTRDALMIGCTNILLAPALDSTGAVAYTPYGLHQMGAKADAFCRFTPDLVARAANKLKKQNAPTIDGKYVAIIHPSVAYDLRRDPDWIGYHQYDASTELFTGEIGELHGVRFVESNLAPVLVGPPLYNEYTRCLGLAACAAVTPGGPMTYGQTGRLTFTVANDLDSVSCTTDWSKMIGQYVLLSDDGQTEYQMQITGVDPAENKISTVGGPASFTVESGKDFLVPGSGGAESAADNLPVALYATMFFGKDAFGVVTPEGAGLELIIKTGHQSGGPLNQYSTVGGKMSHAAQVLYPERMLTIFSASSFSAEDEGNWDYL